MKNKRKHKRYDLFDIDGKMTLANTVKIIDISKGGIALKTDRRLDAGREYMIKLGDEEHAIDVAGTVVRSTLVGMEPGDDGENVLIYSAGMKFKPGAEDKIAAFLDSVDHHKKPDAPPEAERRLHVRFQITTPQDKVLAFPVHFKVKDIGFNSMVIHANEPLGRESTVPMELHLSDSKYVHFQGKVFSVLEVAAKDRTYHEITVAFSDLTDQERTLLKEFIDYLMIDPDMRKTG